MPIASVASLYSNQVILPEYQVRLNELQTKVQTLGKKIGTNINVKFEITHSLDGPSASSFVSNVIYIPAWFLIKYEDIPAAFRLNHANDPRLTDLHFINQFVSWLNEKFAQMGLSIRYSKGIDIQELIFFAANRETYDKGKDFVLAHEFAHKLHDRNHFCSHHSNLILFLGSQAFAVMVMITSHLAFPAFETTSAIASFASIFFGTGYFFATYQSHCINEEKLADIDAVKLLEETAGAILYFQNALLFNQMYRARIPSEKQLFDDQGNFLADTYHPLLTERIKYVLQWQAEHAQQPIVSITSKFE
jgi:hypothetical protein